MTIHFLLSHARLSNQLLAQFAARTDLTLGSRLALVEIIQEGRVLSSGLAELGRQQGAGNYPNTFVKGGVYMYVNSPDEEQKARADGWVVASFPETMVRFGSPDIIVHNAVEKNKALDLGYSLPGLPPIVVMGGAPSA